MKIPIPNIKNIGAALLLGLLPGPLRADILYVSDFNGHAIDKFASDGTLSVFTTSANLNPTGMAFDSTGNLFVTNIDTSQLSIRKYTPAGVGSFFANPGPPNSQGLAFDGAGNLYSANDSDNNILKFTTG